MRSILLLLCTLASTLIYAQDLKLSSLFIADSLKQNVDSVIRDDITHITIASRREMEIERERTITVFTKDGLGDIDAYAHYDDVSKIKDIDAVIYNNLGVEIEHFRDGDFIDASAADGISIFNDTRIKYLRYTPKSYPFTVKFTMRKTSANTSFIPAWVPLTAYESSTERSYYDITYDPSLGLRHKKSHVPDDVTITETEGFLSVASGAQVAVKREYLGPAFLELMPHIKFSLSLFHLEGEDGNANDWSSLGKWMNDALLADTVTLDPEVIATAKALVQDVTDVREKAKIIYEFMQNRTRYVSIQMGIGGWKPMPASQVHELGYGDCKGLSNYTRALLSEVGVPSNYVVVYGDSNLRNIEEDFPSIMGNHAILTVPYDDDYIWLECTSQEAPFGHIAGFTDDRDVLIVSETGGEIVHTKIYEAATNLRATQGSLQLSADGMLSGDVQVAAGGSRYGTYKEIEASRLEDSVDNLKYLWSYLNGVQLADVSFTDEKPTATFKTKATIQVKDYIQNVNGEYIYALNALNRFQSVPKRYRKRKQSFAIDRGRTDTDEVKVVLPKGWEAQALPEAISMQTPFGDYNAEVTLTDGTLVYKRILIRKKGSFSADQYKEYRDFLKDVARADNRKIILKPSL